MATQVKDFSTDLGALSVIFDGMDENSEIKEKIESVYTNPQEYLYFSDINTNAGTILKKIRELSHRMDIIMPDNGNIVFFYILPLKKLTKEWVTDYFERIEMLAKQFMVADSTQHQHICCFTYEMMDLEEGNNISNAIQLLQELAAHEFENPVFREQYLLYTSGIATLEEQENAMIQLLHLMSRKLYFAQLGFDADSSKYIKVINQSAYYEGQAILLDKRISEIETWQTEEYDPDHAYVAAEIRDAIQPLLLNLEKEQREFNDRVQLYPVNIRDYKRKLLKYECTLGEKERHPIVEKRKNSFFDGKAEEIAGSFDPQKVLKFAKQNLFYKDLQNLSTKKENEKEMWEENKKSLKEIVFQTLSIEKKTEEIKQFAEQLYRKLEEALEQCADISEALYKERDREKKRCMKMKSIAGKYENLSDCCMKIVAETKYTIPTTFPLEKGTKLITLVNGKLRSGLTNQLSQIAGCDVAYAYQNIDPVEIVCLKVGSYINLTDTKTSEYKLKQILY